VLEQQQLLTQHRAVGLAAADADLADVAQPRRLAQWPTSSAPSASLRPTR
jgi:hypothetical protein